MAIEAYLNITGKLDPRLRRALQSTQEGNRKVGDAVEKVTRATRAQSRANDRVTSSYRRVQERAAAAGRAMGGAFGLAGRGAAALEGKLDPRLRRALQSTQEGNRKVGDAVEKVTRATRAQSRANDRVTSSYRRVQERAAAAGRAMGGAFGLAGRGAAALEGKLVAVAGSLGAIAALRRFGNIEERFTRLGIQANISAEAVNELRDKIYETAQASDIRVDADQMTAAVEKIVEKTGDLGLAERNLRNIGLAIQASGAAGADIGAMVADLAEKFGISDEMGINLALDKLVNQGKAGAFTLQNLAAQGERVTAAYAALGRTGPEAIAEMGALLQAARKGTGSAEQAATSLERLLAEIVGKAGALEGLGVQVWDPEALAKGEKRARSAVDIVKEIIRRPTGIFQKFRRYSATNLSGR